MKTIRFLPLVIALFALSLPLYAQEDDQATTVEATSEGRAETAAPGDVPADIAGISGTDNANVDISATSTSQAPDGEPALDLTTAAGGKYIYTTLRVAVNGGSCGHADWNCMTNQCRSQLGSGAWRGWAGCWKKNDNFICYYECAASRDTF